MTDIAALERIVKEITNDDEVLNATVVSRSGMHIAGTVPEGVHQETFVAMSAILLGAAETATSELKEELKNVVLTLKGSRMTLHSAGSKALLVIQIQDDAHIDEIFEKANDATAKLATMID